MAGVLGGREWPKPFYGVDGNLLVEDLSYNLDDVEAISTARSRPGFGPISSCRSRWLQTTRSCVTSARSASTGRSTAPSWRRSVSAESSIGSFGAGVALSASTRRHCGGSLAVPARPLGPDHMLVILVNAPHPTHQLVRIYAVAATRPAVGSAFPRRSCGRQGVGRASPGMNWRRPCFSRDRDRL